jgi:hypothetical protein
MTRDLVSCLDLVSLCLCVWIGMTCLEGLVDVLQCHGLESVCQGLSPRTEKALVQRATTLLHAIPTHQMLTDTHRERTEKRRGGQGKGQRNERKLLLS